MNRASVHYRNCRNCGHVDSIMEVKHSFDDGSTLTIPYVCFVCMAAERRSVGRLKELVSK